MNIPQKQQETLLRRAMKLAAETAEAGNLPFAALLVDDNGSIILEAKNTVNSTQNAAAHAEINLLFEAGKILKTNNLSQYALVSNAASCPMCATAAIKAKITHFYYGAPNEGSMVPNITMDEVITKTSFPIEVHGGILADECAERINKLARRREIMDIYKAAGIIIKDRKLLFTRAKDMQVFIDPGGKIEEGETATQALVRELQEELTIDVTEKDLEFFGEYTAEAANHKGKTVHMQAFIVKKYTGEIKPSAEIEELLWLTSDMSSDIKVGSIFGGIVLPALKEQGLVD